MTRTYKDGEKERGEGRQDGDALRMLTQYLLCYLYHPVHTARSLQHTRTGHSGNDNVDDVRRRIARLQTKPEDQDCKSDARDGT